MSFGTVQAEKMTTESGYSLGAGNSSSFKNRIINGGMVVNQYSTTGTAVTFTSSNGYTLDRWNQTNTGSGTLTGTQSSVVPNTTYPYSYLATVSTGSSPASGTVVRLVQAIEGYNMADWAWGTADAKPVMLSFWVRSSLTGTFGGCLQVGTSNGNYVFQYTISAANTWQQVQIAIPANTAYTTNTTNSAGAMLYFDRGSGSSFEGTASTWTSAINKWRASGNVQLSATTGATWYMTGCQVEVGTVATSFDFRDYGRELLMCKRYYHASEALVFAQPTSSSLYIIAYYPVTMRAVPTIVRTGNGSVTGSTAGTTFSSTTTDYTFAGNGTGNIAAGGSYTASAEL